jgi:hypothetical protein
MYELGSYISEDGILHSNRSENFKYDGDTVLADPPIGVQLSAEICLEELIMTSTGREMSAFVCVFRNVTELRRLGTTVTNHNLIQEEINRRLNSGNACCHSVHNLLSSVCCLKNVRIILYKTIFLPVLQYGCKTWSLTLRKGHRLSVFENWVLRRILGLKWDEVTGVGENCVTRSFVTVAFDKSK